MAGLTVLRAIETLAPVLSQLAFAHDPQQAQVVLGRGFGVAARRGNIQRELSNQARKESRSAWRFYFGSLDCHNDWR
jgi:hypothetical protein